jgi:hypothetical protein
LLTRVMAMLLGMCCQLTFNQLIAIFVNPLSLKKCPKYC